MNKKILFLGVFAVCFAAGAVAPRFFMPPLIPVTTPHRGEAIDAVYATGVVEPSIMVPIAPRSSGHISFVGTDEGQMVKKGDILARLEDAQQKATLSDLKARLSFAATTLKRRQELASVGAAGRESVDSARADVRSLEAQIAKATAEANFLNLVAPADGLIIKRDAEIGTFVPSGQALFYMSCCAPLRITAEVDEEDIPRVKAGQPVLIQTDAFGGQVFNGTVKSITPKGDPVARSYRVRIALDSANTPLMIGMTTEINIIVQKTDKALMIPLTALSDSDHVQVVNKDFTIRSIPVTQGIKGTDSVEIISGLNDNSMIVTDYQDMLKDGDKIRLQSSPTPKDSQP